MNVIKAAALLTLVIGALAIGLWIGMHTHHTVYKNCNGMTIEAPKDLAI